MKNIIASFGRAVKDEGTDVLKFVKKEVLYDGDTEETIAYNFARGVLKGAVICILVNGTIVTTKNIASHLI